MSTIINGSVIISLYRALAAYYSHSATKKIFGALGSWYGGSLIASAFTAFVVKSPAIKYSRYGSFMGKISGMLTKPAQKIHATFAVMVGGSRAISVFTAFAQNSAENKFRAVSVFMFYFLLTLTGLGLLGYGFEGRLSFLFIGAITFLLASIFAKGIVNGLDNSVVAGLIKGFLE